MSTLEDLIFAAIVCAIAHDPAYGNLPLKPRSAHDVQRMKRVVLAEVERALAQERRQTVAGPDQDNLLLMLDGLPPIQRRLIRSGALPDLVEHALTVHLVAEPPSESA